MTVINHTCNLIVCDCMHYMTRPAYFCFLSCSCWLWILGGLPSSQRHQIYGASIVLGLGCSTLLVTSLAMTAELVGDNTVCPLASKQVLLV